MKKLFVFMLVCFVSVISCFGQEKKGYISDDKTAGGEISIFEQDGCNIVSFVYVMEVDSRYFDEREMVSSYFVIFDSYEEAKMYYKKMVGKIRTFNDFFKLWMYNLSDKKNQLESAHRRYVEDGVVHTQDILINYDF